jgi:hypothetical protein
MSTKRGEAEGFEQPLPLEGTEALQGCFITTDLLRTLFHDSPEAHGLLVTPCGVQKKVFD